MHRGSKDEKTRSCPISCYSRPACPGLGTGHHPRRSLLRLGRPRHRRAFGSIPGLTLTVVLYARQKSPWTAACPRTEVWTARSTEKKRGSSLCPLIHVFVVGRVCAHCSRPLPGRDVGARWSPAEVKELCFCATWAWTGAKCAPLLTPSWADGTLGILHVVGGGRRYCGTILADAHAKC